MRAAVVFGTLVVLATAALGQKKDSPPVRYGIEADLDAYPQDTAKAALASVIKVIDARRFDYLAAQLADPVEVDKKVQELGGKFDRYIKLVSDRFLDDPEALRQLRRFAAEGEFNVNGDSAVVSVKEIKGRQVFLRQISGRWFFQDRQKAEKEK